LLANVIALAVQRGWIVQGEENVQQIAEADDCGIEGDLGDFDVAALAGADLLIGRVSSAPAHVSGADGFDALKLFDGGLDAPEASAAEDCGFGWHGD